MSAKIFSGDITRSTAEIIVSSDDTLLSASGGVARSIAHAAGPATKAHIRRLAATSLRRGTVAITGGGRTQFKYIFHAVVLTRERDRVEYPTKSGDSAAGEAHH